VLCLYQGREKEVVMVLTRIERNKVQSVPLLLVKQLRPKQWTKNLLVFAAFLFSFNQLDWGLFSRSVLAFFLFSFISSCVYIINDFMDREADAAHPTKRFRPMASGALSPWLALSFGALLLMISLAAGLWLNISFGFLLFLYFIINVVYSVKLKHVVILDVMVIAAGFVMRAIGGGLAINVMLTPWFLICTMLLSLFLAISKRRGELVAVEDSSSRKVLQFYNKALLDQMNTIVTTATIISYALFTFTSDRTVYLMWTVPLVVYGIFRYLYLIHVEGKGESPDKLLFEDKHILFTTIVYAVSVLFIVYFFE
jgi:4-hydroxybenzoate polyprenyltransferase